jgi:hypothetical protein
MCPAASWPWRSSKRPRCGRVAQADLTLQQRRCEMSNHEAMGVGRVARMEHKLILGFRNHNAVHVETFNLRHKEHIILRVNFELNRGENLLE